MIKSLIIDNLALISHSEINFAQGLNILSGETGAGKSIIIKAINFILGQRADSSIIKNGTPYLKVVASFSNNSKAVSELFDSWGMDFDDDIIISRTLNVDGKSDIRVNGSIINLTMLKQLGSLLVDIYGQHENQILLDPKNYIKIVDNFDTGIELLKERVANDVDKLFEVKRLLEKNFGDESAKLREIEILKFEIKEIEDANISEDEYDSLITCKQKAKSIQKILENLRETNNVLEKGYLGSTLSGAIKKCKSDLNSIKEYDSKYEELSTRLGNVQIEIEDISNEIFEELKNASYSDFDLDNIEQRLDYIKKIYSRYGSDFDGVMKYLNGAKIRLDEIVNNEEYVEKLKKEKHIILSSLFDECKVLHTAREQVAQTISDSIKQELKNLEMKEADFVIEISEFPQFENFENNVTKNGVDKVSFCFSANLGQPLKDLSKVISGGEMSRFMLAYKNVVAKKDGVSCLVFDEIDFGISGVVGQKVAMKLASIAKICQIISITHLAQIACMGDRNFVITKEAQNGDTVSSIREISDNELIAEISRLSGSKANFLTSEAHSIEIIEYAKKFKSSLNKKV